MDCGYFDTTRKGNNHSKSNFLTPTVVSDGRCPLPEQGMGRWVMGQMGHENRMGHMGHGSLGVDP